jgi:hypothetical protein
MEAHVQEAFVEYPGRIEHKINMTLKNTSGLVDHLAPVKDECTCGRKKKKGRNGKFGLFYRRGTATTSRDGGQPAPATPLLGGCDLMKCLEREDR